MTDLVQLFKKRLKKVYRIYVVVLSFKKDKEREAIQTKIKTASFRHQMHYLDL